MSTEEHTHDNHSEAVETIAPTKAHQEAPIAAQAGVTDATPEPVKIQTVPGHQHHAISKIASICFLVALAVVAGALLLQYVHKTSFSPAKPATTSATKAANTDSIAGNATNLQATFLDTPEKLSIHPVLFSDLGYFGQDCSKNPAANQANDQNCPPLVTNDNLVFYKLGTTSDGSVVLDMDIDLDYYDSQPYLLLQTPAGKYVFLGKFDSSFTNSEGFTQADANKNIDTFKKALAPIASLDMTTDLPDLVMPSTLSVSGATLQISNPSKDLHFTGYPLLQGLDSFRIPHFNGSGDPGSFSKLGTDGPYSIYKLTLRQNQNYRLEELYGTIKQVYGAGYALSTDDAVKKLSWTIQSPPSDTEFTRRPLGCGTVNGYLAATDTNTTGLTTVGTDADGNIMYKMPTSAPLFQELYDEDYKPDADTLLVKADRNLTAQQLNDRTAVLLIKNKLGEYVVYRDGNYFQEGGCGKPVIYLYPTKPTDVSVRVGANVTKSEPQYDIYKGWQHVLAQPSGQLSFNGKTYPNLFWEGTGYGVYPAITSGTVVPGSQAVATIRSQLAAQGLNQSEISDFVAFWQPRLPHTKYVRLTWFSKDQIDELAPLSIWPLPDTTIRVFLDFQGLNTPVQLPAQHFSVPSRNGFTAVEWGGLLRNSGKVQ